MNCCRLALAGLFIVSTVVVAEPPRRLTSDGRQKMDPVFVDGGKAIVFTELVAFNQLALKRIDLETKKIERLHPSASASEFAITYSSDDQKFAYLENDGNLHVKIVMRNRETESQVEFNPGGGFAAIRELSIAPNGSTVVFAFPEKSPGQQILSLSMDGKDKQVLTDGNSHNACPRYSPDGRWIAFTSTREGNFDIFTMTADGKVPVQLTKHKGLDTRPSWSPNGRQLAFTSLREGNYDLYVIDADGSNLRRVTQHIERDDFACWNPNGRQLVFVGERDGQYDLYLVDAP